MDDLIKLVKTYRLTEGLSERLRLGEEIFRLIEPDLRLFVFGKVSQDAADDALQEVLKAIATSLQTFSGSSAKEFWSWCYRIARHKVSDHYRAKEAERTVALPEEEFWSWVEASASARPLSPQDRLDLDYAMKLLATSKPPCHELLWQHYVIGLDYADIAEEQNVNYDTIRMKISRCLQTAQSLMSHA